MCKPKIKLISHRINKTTNNIQELENRINIYCDDGYKIDKFIRDGDMIIVVMEQYLRVCDFKPFLDDGVWIDV